MITADLGAEHSTGLSHRVFAATTVAPPTHHALLQPGETGHLKGGDQDAGKRGSSSSAPGYTTGMLHIQPVLVPKKDGA